MLIRVTASDCPGIQVGGVASTTFIFVQEGNQLFAGEWEGTVTERTASLSKPDGSTLSMTLDPTDDTRLTGTMTTVRPDCRYTTDVTGNARRADCVPIQQGLWDLTVTYDTGAPDPLPARFLVTQTGCSVEGGSSRLVGDDLLEMTFTGTLGTGGSGPDPAAFNGNLRFEVKATNVVGTGPLTTATTELNLTGRFAFSGDPKTANPSNSLTATFTGTRTRTSGTTQLSGTLTLTNNAR